MKNSHTAVTSSSASFQQFGTMPPSPLFEQHVSFIDCYDLEACDQFYAGILGLSCDYSVPGYVNFYKVAPSAFLCVCKRGAEAKAKAIAGEYVGKGCIPGFICSTTADVDEWNKKLVAAGVAITKAAGSGISSDGKVVDAIYNVMCKDPTGYLVEFQTFVDPAWPSPPPHQTGALTAAPESAPATDWSEWCVVVVDVQVDFYNAPVQAAFPELPANVGTLLATARKAGIEVVHLREGSNLAESPWYQYWLRMNPGKDSCADATAPCPFAAEVGAEQVFTKYGYDGTGDQSGLCDYLKRRKKRSVLVCGLVTSCCVHLNAAGLFLRGWESYVIDDCSGDRTKEMHDTTLAGERGKPSYRDSARGH